MPNQSISKFVIIVAGGQGTRFNNHLPKQFHNLKGKPVVIQTIFKFIKADSDFKIVLVTNPDYINYTKALLTEYKLVDKILCISGGKERFDSVKIGLHYIKNNFEIESLNNSVVAIHDAVRPIISTKLINFLFNEAEVYSSSIPYIKSNQSMRIRLDVEENSFTTVNREDFIFIQTPQVFEFNKLIMAYNQLEFSPELTDDASVYEKGGFKLQFVPGEPNNIKLTTKEDLDVAESLFKL